jgi:hypothetical protein
MSTPVGHSRRQPLQETQSFSVSGHLVGRQSVDAELAGDGKPQRIGPARASRPARSA